MEYSCFPGALEKSLREQIDDFNLLKDNEAVVREEEIKSKYNSLGVIDDSLKGFFKLLTRGKFLSIFLAVTVLSAVVGLLVSVEMGFSENWSTVVPLSVGIGLLAGSLGRMLLGETVGSLFFFILYPIYRRICISVVEKRMNKRNEEIKEIRDKLSLAKERFNERKMNELEEYRRGFEEEARRLCDVYSASDNLRQIGLLLSEYLVNKLTDTPRPASLRNINVLTEIVTVKDGIYYDDIFFDFVENRYQSLDSPIEQAALLIAVCRYISKNVASSYKKDVSGTAYRLKSSYALYESATAHIEYSCENGGFIPARAW